jgi:hypothetical protein
MLQFQRLIVSGELPCSKEEAATLAGIQLRLEEAWPDRDLDQLVVEEYDLRGPMAAATSSSTTTATAASAATCAAQHMTTLTDGDDRERETLLQPENNGPSSTSAASVAANRRLKTANAASSSTVVQPSAVYIGQNRKTKMTTTRRHGRLTTARSSISGGCIDGEEGVRSCFRLPDGAMVKCLPPEYRSSRAVRGLIEVSG